MSKTADENVNHKKLETGFIFIFDNVLPFALCLFGATTQVLTLMTMYFTFPINTVIEMYPPTVISIPSVSICFLYDVPLNFLLSTINHGVNISDFRFELSIRELNFMTANYDQFVVNCKVIKNDIENVENVDCKNISDPLTHINGRSKCFTLFRSTSNYLTYNLNKFSDEYLLTFDLATKYAFNGNFFVVLHGKDEEVEQENGSPATIFLQYGRSNTFTLTFNINQLNRKKYPYTDCVDYRQTIGLGKRDAVQRCIRQMVYHDHQSYSEKTFIHVPGRYDDLKFKDGIMLVDYIDFCEKKYHQPECSFQLYNINLRRKYSNNKLDDVNQVARVEFAFPLGMQANVSMVNRVDDIEYFCYVASLFSLWLEISILTVARFIFHNIRKLLPKFYRRLNNRWQEKSSYDHPKSLAKKKVKTRKTFPAKIGYLRESNKSDPYYLTNYSNTCLWLQANSRHLFLPENRIKWKPSNMPY